MSDFKKARVQMQIATDKLMAANTKLMQAIKTKSSAEKIATLREEEDSGRSEFNQAVKYQQSKM